MPFQLTRATYQGAMWTHECVDILIEEYRARPILYDTKDPLYHNRVKKSVWWIQKLKFRAFLLRQNDGL